MTPQDLKNSILKLAFQGKLVSEVGSKEIASTDYKIDIRESSSSPINIPNSWHWSTIGACCDLYTGNSISESEKKAKYQGCTEGYSYIGTKNVSFNHDVNYDNGIRIPFNTDFKIAYKGSILMCIEGGSAGKKIAVLDHNVCFGNKLCMFNTNDADIVLNMYLYYYLQSTEFKKIFKDNMTGIIGGVSIRKIKNIAIPLPPLSEQKRIVDKIEELMPMLDQYELAWTKLDYLDSRFPSDIRKSILQEAMQGRLVEQRPEEGSAEELYCQIQEEKERLVKEGKIKKEKPLPEVRAEEEPFEIPKTWKWVRLGDLLQVISGVSYDKKDISSAGYRILRGGNIQQTKILLEKDDVFLPEQYRDSKKEIHQGDILIVASTGSKTIIGKPGFVDCPIPNTMIGAFLRICRSYTVYTQDWLKCLFSSEFYREHIRDLAGGTNINNIRESYITEFVVPLPPLKEQKRIANRLNELLALCSQLEGRS